MLHTYILYLIKQVVKWQQNADVDLLYNSIKVKKNMSKVNLNHNADTGLGFWQSLLQSVTDKHITFIDLYN